MPPKAKFTRKEIIDKALEIVRRDGIEGLTARALGEKLGSSARPIFTVFENMEELEREVMSGIRAVYSEYIEIGLSSEIPFKGVGAQYIMFAIREPRMFRILFMREHKENIGVSDILPVIDENYDRILGSVKDGYKLDDREAKTLYSHLWIYTHGIAALCATGMCRFTGEEISNMMSEVFVSLLKKMKEGKGND